MIYLDHAATTPVPRPVADAMYQVLTEQFGNPSSQYPWAGRPRPWWRMAGLLSPGPWGAGRRTCTSPPAARSRTTGPSPPPCGRRHTGRHIITTAVEHSAVLEPCKLLQQQGYEVALPYNNNIPL